MTATPRPALLLAFLVLILAVQAGAQSPEVPEASDAPEATDAAPRPVALDALLQLPKDAPTIEAETYNGVSRKEWEARFSTARSDVEAARADLAQSQAELEEMASETAAWQMAAPGASANAENSPVSFKLRQEIRKGREDLARAEGVLEELRIEANLAGVPEEWQD